MALHRKHQCQSLDGLLEELATPQKLPEDLAKDQKDVDGLLGRLIGDLEALRTNHKKHIENYSLETRKYSGLLQRLLQGEQLHSQEATGDAIFNMVAEASQVSKVKSPYRLAGDQLRNELQGIETTTQQILERFERIWKEERKLDKPIVKSKEQEPLPKMPQKVPQTIPQPKTSPKPKEQTLPQIAYKFSNQLKHQDITINNNNTISQCYSGSGDNYFLRAGVVEPSASPTTVSKVIFKAGQLPGWVAVGICVPSALAASHYTFYSNCNCNIGQKEGIQQAGVFAVNNVGMCYTHGSSVTRTDFKFDQYEEVGVEWNPSKMEVSWWVVGTNRRRVQYIPEEVVQTNPVNFVVAMMGGFRGGASSISLVV